MCQLRHALWHYWTMFSEHICAWFLAWGLLPARAHHHPLPTTLAPGIVGRVANSLSVLVGVDYWWVKWLYALYKWSPPLLEQLSNWLMWQLLWESNPMNIFTSSVTYLQSRDLNLMARNVPNVQPDILRWEVWETVWKLPWWLLPPLRKSVVVPSLTVLVLRSFQKKEQATKCDQQNSNC